MEYLGMGAAAREVPREIAIGIEQVEAAAWLDCFAAAPEPLVQRFGIATGHVDGLDLFAMRQSGMTLFNRMLGLGVRQAASAETLATACAWLARHGAPQWAAVLAPSPAADGAAMELAQRGLHAKVDGLMKFYRDAAVPVAAVDCAYPVRLVGAQQAAGFSSTAGQALGLEQGVDALFAELCGRPQWRTYAAYDGDMPVGVGALYVCGEYGWLGVGGTLEAYRRRGVQGALLARRIQDAHALGARTLTIETHRTGRMDAPNGSHRNVLRAGFVPAYFKQVFVNA